LLTKNLSFCPPKYGPLIGSSGSIATPACADFSVDLGVTEVKTSAPSQNGGHRGEGAVSIEDR
jgi:hypothetical protein